MKIMEKDFNEKFDAEITSSPICVVVDVVVFVPYTFFIKKKRLPLV